MGSVPPSTAEQRAWFAQMIRDAFPAEHKSATANALAEWLTEQGFPTSVRQAHYWLVGQHTAAFDVVMAVLCLVGPERIFDMVPPRE